MGSDEKPYGGSLEKRHDYVQHVARIVINEMAELTVADACSVLSGILLWMEEQFNDENTDVAALFNILMKQTRDTRAAMKSRVQ